MDRRCLFILFSTILYANNIHCDGNIKHNNHPIDFLKPTNEDNLKHEVIATTTKSADVITTTAKTNTDESNGVQKFIDDVKNKFNHIHPVRDVKHILFGSANKSSTTMPPAGVSTSSTTESHIHKIVESMPSESEDMIRVVTLKDDQHYGKGKAKPQYLTRELEKMNSTEYVEGTTSTTKKTVDGGKVSSTTVSTTKH